MQGATGVRTRARLQGHLQDLLGIVARAGLLGAVANTVLVVHGVAQAGHVVGLAAKLGSLGVHAGDAHMLSSHLGQQIDVRQRNQDMGLTAHSEMDMAAVAVLVAASRAIATEEKDFIVLGWVAGEMSRRIVRGGVGEGKGRKKKARQQARHRVFYKGTKKGD